MGASLFKERWVLIWVVIVCVGSQNATQMRFAPNDDMIETLTPDRRRYRSMRFRSNSSRWSARLTDFHEINAYIQRQRRFLGNAAHQLRTPLTLLRAKIDDVTEPALKADLIRDVRRLASLVSAMLDLARLQNHGIEKRPIDLGALTRDVLADFSPSALDAGIELSLEQAPQGSVVVLGVEAAVRSALANLVGNALIHARGAARIVANLGRGSVSISDDGAGFSPAPQLSVIEPFQTGATAKVGRGTTVCLSFPEAPRERRVIPEPAM